MRTEEIVIDLVGCARCHGDGHPALTFKPLAHPIEYDAGRGDGIELELTHWCPCPTNGEPILMRFVED